MIWWRADSQDILGSPCLERYQREPIDQTKDDSLKVTPAPTLNASRQLACILFPNAYILFSSTNKNHGIILHSSFPLGFGEKFLAITRDKKPRGFFDT